jgi:hyperosmotically inducible protein
MKRLRVIEVVSGVLIILAPFNAYAQSSDAPIAPNAMASSSPTAHLSNQALEKNVRRALETTHDLSVSQITVRACNGAVTLEGTVPQYGQIDRAIQVAQGVSGVSSVKNYLTIRQEAE